MKTLKATYSATEETVSNTLNFDTAFLQKTSALSKRPKAEVR